VVAEDFSVDRTLEPSGGSVVRPRQEFMAAVLKGYSVRIELGGYLFGRSPCLRKSNLK
jgi:hypothetical protein